MDSNKCHRCNGTGKYHNSPLSHREKSCLFCTTCEVCQGRGSIGGVKSDEIYQVDTSNQWCKPCGGTGKIHNSPMQHTGMQCIFCTECPDCRGEGFVQQVTETVDGTPAWRLSGASKNCGICHGHGVVHNSLMTHRTPCPYCEPCPNCRGTASRDQPDENTALIRSGDDEQGCCKCTLL